MCIAETKERIVDRQFKEWMAKSRTPISPEAPAAAVGAVTRIITITGQYGALADTVGEEIARQLGFTLYDRQLVSLIAEKANVAPSLVEAAERGDQTYLDELMGAMMASRFLRSPEYVPRLTEVLHLIAEREKAVILGRGANVILGPARALRVRCIAPVNLRVERVALHLDTSPDEAARITAREDERRVRMVRSLMGQDPTDPAVYDLVVSTEFLTPGQAATAVVAVYRTLG